MLRHGEYPLVFTFWALTTGVIAVVLLIGFFFVGPLIFSTWSVYGKASGVMILLVWATVVYAYLFQAYIGVYRAAEKYAGPAIWKALAKLMVFVWFGAAFYRIIGFIGLIANK